MVLLLYIQKQKNIITLETLLQIFYYTEQNENN